MTSDCLHTSEPNVGRFAPSPTGPLHLGSLVSALGSYLVARSKGGEWLLRMEDLDTPRVVPGAADDILRTLESLGLCWDREVIWQSRRLSLYEEAFRQLCDAGFVYPCGCSRSEIARVATASGDTVIYPGTCRQGLPPGKPPRAYRIRASSVTVSFTDLVQGAMETDVAVGCGDFVIRRADGPFAYHLAVVVDDADNGVTEVVRGADLLEATPCHLYLQGLLGLTSPSYAHLPLVTGTDGGKLSKRDNVVSLVHGLDLATQGGILTAAALRFLGQDVPRELAHAPASELLQWGIGNFDASMVPKSGGPFPDLSQEGA